MPEGALPLPTEALSVPSTPKRVRSPRSRSGARSLPTSTQNSTSSSPVKPPEDRKLFDVIKENKGMPMENSTSSFEVAKRIPFTGRKRNALSLLEQRKQPGGPSIASVVAPQIRIVDGRVVLDDQAALMAPALESAATSASSLTIVHESVDKRHYTSSTYARYSGSNRWTEAETELFYKGLSMCGTDFGMMAELFKGSKTREQIKGKFRIEERNNPILVARSLNNPHMFEMPSDRED